MTIRRKIINLALPAMAENFLQMLMGLVDNYLVAQLGLIAVSGVSVANNIITIYQAIFLALGAASSSLLAKSLGKNDKDSLLTYQGQALLITLFLGLILAFFSLFFGQPLLGFLGTEDTVRQAGGLYLALVGGGSLGLGFMLVLSAFHRAQGRAAFPLYVSLLTNLLNAILSALSIYVLQWGIVGVALATVFSRLMGALILTKQVPLAAILKHLSLKKSRELLALALPAAGERLMMRAGDVAVVAIIVSFGTEVVAGNAIGESLTQFNYMPGMGVATATIILVANSLGSDNLVEAKAIIRQSYWLACSLMLLVGGASFLLGGQLSQLFTQDATAMTASKVVLLYSFLGGPATAGTLIYTAAWQGLGNARLPFYATSFGMWCIRIIVGYLLGRSLGLGLSGVWIATVADNIFRWLFLYGQFRHHRL